FVQEIGSDLVWDFSNLPFSEATREVTVVEPDSMSLIDIFPNTNIGLDKRDGQQEHYLLQTDSTLEIVGVRFALGTTLRYPNSRKLMQFPFALGEHFSDEYTMFSVSPEGDTTYQAEYVETHRFLASGNLQLPNGNYGNVYLICNEVSTNGTPPTSSIYTWYAGSLANPVLKIAVSKHDGLIDAAIWQFGTEVVSSVDEIIHENELNVKWLTQNQFVIDSDKKRTAQCSVTDVNGRLIWQQKQEILIGEQEITIPNLSAVGVYFFSIQDLRTQELKTIQFTTGY
ncbi:MAG: hypothetical protein AB8G22_14880, partial [Saprospiraceae bacterium]